MITLTPKQNAAEAIILDWLRSPSKQVFKLGGYAGTGKTTLIKSILQNVECQYAVTSFTGKAVSVLRKKGMPNAQTLHSFLYTPEVQPDGSVVFRKRTQQEMEQTDLIVNDESSMLNSQLHTDALETGAKLLYVGDPGQLEPVGDNPNLMRDCDLTLEEIHRQAYDSPILSLATAVRLSKHTPVHGTHEARESTVRICSKFDAVKVADEVDQVICGLNSTRKSLNQTLRSHYKRVGPLCEQEKLICLRNDARKGLFNGMTLYVRRIKRDWDECFLCDLQDDLERNFFNIKVNKKALLQGEWTQADGKVPFEHNLFTYGYCITCHKAQGSEWDSVMVIDQAHSLRNSSPERWRYTAITRAAKKLVYGI